MVLTLQQVMELKKHLEEHTNQSVHLHDACGGQYFSLDYADEQAHKVLVDYFSAKGISVNFAMDKKGFTLKEK